MAAYSPAVMSWRPCWPSTTPTTSVTCPCTDGDVRVELTPDGTLTVISGPVVPAVGPNEMGGLRVDVHLWVVH